MIHRWLSRLSWLLWHLALSSSLVGAWLASPRPWLQSIPNTAPDSSTQREELV